MSLLRGLKAHKSAAIEMIVVDSPNPFTASVVKAVQEIPRANGYAVVLASSGDYPVAERFHIVLAEQATMLPDAINI
jgi:DNA-binding LacI/PurR family transcriptional regulator